jgi:hypothetical protein
VKHLPIRVFVSQRFFFLLQLAHELLRLPDHPPICQCRARLQGPARRARPGLRTSSFWLVMM